MKILYIFYSILLFSSCSVVIPDHKVAQLANMKKESALLEIDQYNKLVFQKGDILSNIAFKFKGRTMTALGITNIDEKNKAYKVAALSPMGVTLFQLEVKNKKIISSYIIPKFTPDSNDKDMTDKAVSMISQDIALIYFNRTFENKTSLLKLDKYNVSIDAKSGDKQSLKYVFAGNPLKLITKIKYENTKKLWSVDYYDYQSAGLKEMPFKIIFQNHKYGYMLEIETKKVANN
jgi:hypothetical protein